MSTGYLDVCKFLATSTGTADFVPFAAVTGYQTPASAGAVDGKRYYYRAESTDLTQWEVGYGNYTVSGTTLARTTILFSSNSNSKVSFTAAPQVAIVAVAETMVPQTIGQLPGTATNDAAAAGNVGELLSSVVASGSQAALTTATPLDITSLALSAGDWDVWGEIQFSTNTTTSVTAILGSLSTSSGSLVTTVGQFDNHYKSAVVPGAATGAFASKIGPFRVSLSGSTTYYLTADAAFTVSNMSAYGGIFARRVR